MPGPSRAGVLFYAKDLEGVATFYERVLDARVLHADEDHRVISTQDAQVIIHAIPPHIATSITIAVPPEPREEQAIKPFFTVASLGAAKAIAEECGGMLFGPVYAGPGFTARNACDPEGNIVHLRETAA